jgi:hypothetical protein
MVTAVSGTNSPASWDPQSAVEQDVVRLDGDPTLFADFVVIFDVPYGRQARATVSAARMPAPSSG